jgi:BetR domain.
MFSAYFLHLLKIKEQDKGLLAENVANLLCIDKSSAYRRLRGEIVFTFDEICQLSKYYYISMDEIAFQELTGEPRSIYLRLPVADVSEPDSMGEMHLYIDRLKRVAQKESSEVYIAANSLQSIFYSQYQNIFKFFVFKWRYRGNLSVCEDSTYSDLEVDDMLYKTQQDLSEACRNFASITCIWDLAIIAGLVNDVKYFRSIRLIGDEDVKAIKEELSDLLSDIEWAATRGYIKDTNAKLELYLSSLDIESTMYAFGAADESVALISVFMFHSPVSFNELAHQKVKEWIKHMRRFSILLSGTGDMVRVRFFEKQHRIINSL